MATGEFHHFGVPSQTQREGETYIEGGKVFVTDPDQHPYRLEFLRFEPDSPLPDVVKTKPHAAFMVRSLDQALEGKKVILPPFNATDTLRVAFIQDGEAIIELMQEV